MPKKLTIKYVSDFVEENSNKECKVLSENYVNNETPIKIKCKCGEVFERDFSHIKRNRCYCRNCSLDRQSKMFRSDINDIKDFIKSKGCEYISGDYKNNNSILTIRCNCGNVFNKRYAKFYMGQTRCNDCAKIRLSKSKIKYTIDDISREIEPLGYVICDKNQYVNTLSRLDCICPKGHKFKLVYAWFKYGEGCYLCGLEKNKGKNSPHFKGGVSSTIDSLREGINEWRKNTLDLYDNSCAISNNKEKVLDVHHLTSFSTIIKRAEEKCGIVLKPALKDYDDLEDFYTLKETVIKENEKEMGIPISKKIHIEFHKMYGKNNNTAEQFDDFLKKRYNTTLKDILKTK